MTTNIMTPPRLRWAHQAGYDRAMQQGFGPNGEFHGDVNPFCFTTYGMPMRRAWQDGYERGLAALKRRPLDCVEVGDG